MNELAAGHSYYSTVVGLGAGHGGAPGRHDRWRETAPDCAFLLHLAGPTGAAPSRERLLLGCNCPDPP